MRRLASLFLVLGLAACGTESSGTAAESGGGGAAGVSGSRGVTQGGPQDIALFREIVGRGRVPAPGTLDPVGFFAEHAMDLPPADCGEVVCIHPMLAVAPRFDGGNWTMAFVAMNSPVDPATLERPPLHLIAALERSTITEESWRGIELGLRVLASRLREGDRLSLVVFGARAEALLAGSAPETDIVDDALRAARVIAPSTEVALYDGLAVAGRLSDDPEGFDGLSRILLLTSGRATAGVTTPERVIALAGGLARQGIAINVLGVGGAAYDPRIPQRIAELGAGTYTYAEDVADLDRIFRYEGDTTLFPLATDFHLRIQASPGYRVGRVYGARRAVADGSAASLDSPALFLGHRTGSDDVSGGRRGGGGGLFVELVADPDAAHLGAGQPAFGTSATWTAADGSSRAATQVLVNALAPGQNPDGMWPALSHEAHGNAFMMLNMYLTLRAAVDFYHAGDCARALGVIDMVAPTVEVWQAEYDNPDLWADLDLILALRANIHAQCTASGGPAPMSRPPEHFAGGCMMI